MLRHGVAIKATGRSPCSFCMSISDVPGELCGQPSMDCARLLRAESLWTTVFAYSAATVSRSRSERPPLLRLGAMEVLKKSRNASSAGE
jgi:hypothetical protein